MSIIHHANKCERRPRGSRWAPPASSASSVSLMTALWFNHLTAAGQGLGEAARLAGPARDRVPARAARRPILTPLRDFGGLQSYPCRSRIRSRPTSRRARSGSAPRRRSGARRPPLRGGPFGVLDGGRPSRCSATPSSTRGTSGRRVVEPVVRRLGEVLWIVDLNRQSLDRVVPDIAAARLGAMFEAAGWKR